MYQVRLKAMCILEALLRQGSSSGVFQKVTGRFEDDSGSIIECSRSPQASLKEKSKKVVYPVNFEGGWIFYNGSATNYGTKSQGASRQEIVSIQIEKVSWSMASRSILSIAFQE